jgi:hypothetical protein
VDVGNGRYETLEKIESFPTPGQKRRLKREFREANRTHSKKDVLKLYESFKEIYGASIKIKDLSSQFSIPMWQFEILDKYMPLQLIERLIKKRRLNPYDCERVLAYFGLIMIRLGLFK